MLTSACVCLCLSSKGGKAQIIGPEEEDEDEDGYPFNEARKILVVNPVILSKAEIASTRLVASFAWTLPLTPSLFCVFSCLDPPPSSLSLSDGRSIPRHRTVKVATGPHDGVHEIRLHPAAGSKPSGQST